MSTKHDLALRLAVLKILVAELATAKKAADAEIRDTWRRGDRLTAALPNGKLVGAVTLAKGRATANITDPDAYETWVRTVHPEQIETVPATTRINPAFTDRLKAAARQLGVPVDAETGEIVPGITVTDGDPYPLVKLVDDAAGMVAGAWRSGDLTELMSGLLAIEGGES